jgi:hypothetical protein
LRYLYVVLLTIKAHRYLLLFGLLGLYLYAGIMLNFSLLESEDVGNTLQLSSFLIQSSMLFFMFFGFRKTSNHLGSLDLYRSIKGSILKVYIMNIILLVSTILIFSSTLFIIISAIYYHLNPSNHFYFETGLFLLNYLIIPSFISGLIGMIFGANTEGKFSYAILILLWAILSPTNQLFVSNLLSNVQFTSGHDLIKNLNIGIQDMNMPYHPFYGYEYLWGKKLLLVSFLSMILLFSIIYIDTGKSFIRKLNILSVFFSLTLFSLVPYSSQENPISDFLSDYQYFSENKSKMSDQKLFDYKIDRMDIHVNNENKFKVFLKYAVSNVKGDQIAFTLYKGFKILKVQSANQDNLKFTQLGDHTIVDLMGSNSKTQLEVIYEGKGTTLNPARREAVYLPQNFNWLPTNKRVESHFTFNEHLLPSDVNEDSISFTLNYIGNELDFVNLKRVNDAEYKGISQGVTLIDGDLTKVNIGNHIMIYPQSWFSYEGELIEYVNEFKRVLKNYNALFGVEHKMPKNLVLLPSMAVNDSYIHTFGTSDQNHLILQLDPVDITQKRPINTSIPYQIDSVFNEMKSLNAESFASWLMFNSFLGSQISDNTPDIHTTNFETYLRSVSEPYIHKRSTHIVKKLLTYKDKKLPTAFLLEWKNLLNDRFLNDWEQLDELINRYELEGIL